MAGNTLVALTSATYDTSTPLFGTGALTGAYGNSSTGAGGISGPTGLSAVGWTIELAAKGAAAPSSTIVLAGYNNTPTYSNSFYVGVTASGFLTAVIWDSTGSGATGAHTYTGASSLATGTWQRIAVTVISGNAYIFLNGALVSTLSPNSGKNFATCIPPNVSLGNFYGTPTFPATGWEIDEAVVWPSAKYTANYTPSASAFAGTEGMVSLWHLDSTLADSSANSVTVTTPGLTTVGAIIPLTGTYSGTLPTGINYYYDSTASYVAASGFTASGGTWVASTGADAPSAGSHTITVQEANSTGTTATSGSFTTSASVVTIAPNNAAIVYSPYNWLVGSSAAETINPGAYFKTCFTGSSITLNFNVTNNATPVPQLWYSIDGQPFVQIESLGAAQNLTMPTTTTAWALHTLLVVVKSTSEFVTRWTPQDAAVILTSITLASGSTVSAPTTYPNKILVYGDSITEGYHTINSNGTGTNDCDGSDSILSYSCLEKPLGAEVGVVGFGGQRLAITGGQGGVPALTTSYNLLWSGQARTFSPVPKLIVINIGTNDFPNGVSQATFQASMITLLNDLITACPGSIIAVMQPFEGWGTTFTPTMRSQCTAAIQAAIAAVNGAPIVYIPTTGMFTSSNPSVDGTHPLGVTTISSILPQLVPLLQPLLQPTPRAYSFN